MSIERLSKLGDDFMFMAAILGMSLGEFANYVLRGEEAETFTLDAEDGSEPVTIYPKKPTPQGKRMALRVRTRGLIEQNPSRKDLLRRRPEAMIRGNALGEF